MPRVPLQKRKQAAEDKPENVHARPGSRVEVMAQRIKDAKMKRMKKENEPQELKPQVDISESEAEATHGDVTNNENPEKKIHRKMKRHKRGRKAQKEEHENNHIDMKEMTDTCESSEDGAGVGGMIEIAVDVHHGGSSVDDESELEGAVGGLVKGNGNNTMENSPDSDEECLTFTKQNRNLTLGDSSSESDIELDSLEWRKKNRKKIENIHTERMEQTGLQSGEEESSDSDSDGGWDFETGGMPLLPR